MPGKAENIFSYLRATPARCPLMGILSPSRAPTLLVFYRAFVKAGDIAATVRNVKANAAIYPLHATTETGEPPATTFVNTSGVRFNTISANTFGFYEELNGVV